MIKQFLNRPALKALKASGLRMTMAIALAAPISLDPSPGSLKPSKAFAADRVQAERRDSPTKETVPTNALLLAALARHQYLLGNTSTGFLLTLEALSDGPDAMARARATGLDALFEAGLSVLREKIVLHDHKKAVLHAEYSPLGTTIVTASASGAVRLWDAKTGNGMGAPLAGHTERVNWAGFSKDGMRIATASDDKTARIWDVRSGTQIGEAMRSKGAVLAAVFSPDGAQLLTSAVDDDGARNVTLQLWDTKTRQPLGQSFPENADNFDIAVFSRDGKLIVARADTEKPWRAWNAQTRQEIENKPNPDQAQDSSTVDTQSDFAENSRDVPSSVAMSPDGALIVTGSTNGSMRLWDFSTMRPAGPSAKGTDGSIASVAFSVDGKQVASGSQDGSVSLWDVVPGPAYGGPTQLSLKLRQRLGRYDEAITRVDFAPDGKTVVAASRDKTARIWDAETRGYPSIVLPSKTEEAVYRASLSKDGNRIATVSKDSANVGLWDTATGKFIGDLVTDHENGIYRAAFSPDGARIVTASETVRLWDVRTRKAIGKPLEGHTSTVISAVFSPAGKRIVTASSDSSVRQWDASNGKQIGNAITGHRSTVFSAVYSPDGSRILSASSDGTARIWDARTGAQLIEPLDLHRGPVNSASFSPDGTRVVTASDDATARLWDAATGEPIGKPLKGHTSHVYGAAFSPDGTRLLTTSEDNSIVIWDLRTATPVGELIGHEDGVIAASYTNDGLSIVSTSTDGTARIWRLPQFTSQAVQSAISGVPRCLHPDQRAQLFLTREPPRWCITGRDKAQEKSASEWSGKWPYHPAAWKEWLTRRDVGESPPLPAGVGR